MPARPAAQNIEHVLTNILFVKPYLTLCESTAQLSTAQKTKLILPTILFVHIVWRFGQQGGMARIFPKYKFFKPHKIYWLRISQPLCIQFIKVFFDLHISITK